MALRQVSHSLVRFGPWEFASLYSSKAEVTQVCRVLFHGFLNLNRAPHVYRENALKDSSLSPQGWLLSKECNSPEFRAECLYQEPSSHHSALSRAGLALPIRLIVNYLRMLRTSVNGNAQNTNSVHTHPECRMQEFAHIIFIISLSYSVMLQRA